MRWRARLHVMIILMWAVTPVMPYVDAQLLSSASMSWLVEVPLPEGASGSLAAYLGSLSRHLSAAMFFSLGALAALWLMGRERGGERK